MGNILIPQTSKWNWETGKAENCNIYANYRRNRNGTGSFFGTAISGYEGIPQNFVLNLCGWLVLNGLFIVLRKKAWNYGRMAVMQKNEMKWTDMFYIKNPDEDTTSGESNSGVTHEPEKRYITADKRVSRDTRGKSFDFGTPAQPQQSPLFEDPKNKLGNISEIMDSGYFSWIKTVLTLKDEQFKEKCGPDCVFYLSFQRHLIVLALIITACSLIIILPINMQKKIQDPDPNAKSEFSDTTIINLEDRHNFLWAHIILAIIFLFVSIVLMRHYSKELQFVEEDSSDISRSVMIVGINRKKCSETLLRAHLNEVYPGEEITEVSFAYDISKLQKLEFQRLSAYSAKLYCQDVFDNTEKRPRMRPYLCGIVGCWCERLGCKETDAINYYDLCEKRFTEEVEQERINCLQRPLGIAFVTFAVVESAERIVEDYAFTARIFLHTPRSEQSKTLQSQQWIVKYAPLPEDINWQNLTLDYKMWYLKFFVISLILAVVVIIFTTPVYLFTTLAAPTQNLNLSQKAKLAIQNSATETLPVLAGIIIDTLPTILIWMIGIILIVLVSESDSLIGFWTKTAGNLSEMVKIFLFLTFMVIVLPSLGVTSLSYILHSNKVLRWSCIFYKENGALFVNYICTSSLVGTAAELMRLPELFLYACKLCLAKSAAEIGSVRRSILWDFQIGSMYAWTMLHFAIMTSFSVIYPLVTPFGLLYLVMKHWVDRYNIYFAYAPCKVEKGVHGTAVNFVIMCMFMLQVNLLAYVHWHIGLNVKDPHEPTNPEIRALQVFSLLGFSISAALFLGQVCFNVCADFSPIQHFKSMALPEEGPERSDADLEKRIDDDESVGKLDSKDNNNKTRPAAPPAIQITESGDNPSLPAQEKGSLSVSRSNSSDKHHEHPRYVPNLLHLMGHRSRQDSFTKKPDSTASDSDTHV